MVSRYCLKILSSKSCSYWMKGAFVKIIFGLGDGIAEPAAINHFFISVSRWHFILKSIFRGTFALFNFHWKTKVYAVRVNIVIIGQLYLKVKLFHVLVGAMGKFFFRVYIFKHSLESHIECFRNISGNVIVILVFLFFFYFIFCIVIVRSCSVYGRGQSYVVKDRNVKPRQTSSAFLFASWFR